MKGVTLGLEEALSLTLTHIAPLPTENVDLIDCVDRIAASDLFAGVDSPSTDAALKDGYAVRCSDISGASSKNPVRLKVIGAMAAGGEGEIGVRPGTAVRVLTGARIPAEADAVVAGEFAKTEGSEILVDAPIGPGKNVLAHGTDVALNERVLRAGQRIRPGMAGLLAAAGHITVPVFRKPVVGILGIGDEIVEQGKPLTEGKLYASNIITLAGWCTRFGMKTRMTIVRDDYDAIFAALEALFRETDAVITSGGAWTGDRDLAARVLDGLGWKEIFHRIRIGPGKAVGFGMTDGKPAFVLPGGPPSNLMGFLQIALPGLLVLSGYPEPGLPRVKARLASEIMGRDPGWTDFFYGTIEEGEGGPVFRPLKKRSRLGSIAEATAVASIPEGQDRIPEGSTICVQLLE